MSSTGPVVNPAPKDAKTGEVLDFANAGFAAAFKVPPPPVQDPPMREYRGNTLGHPFRFRERMALSREKPMMGMWYGAFPYPGIARVIGQAGFGKSLSDSEGSESAVTLGDRAADIQSRLRIH